MRGRLVASLEHWPFSHQKKDGLLYPQERLAVYRYARFEE